MKGGTDPLAGVARYTFGGVIEGGVKPSASACIAMADRGQIALQAAHPVCRRLWRQVRSRFDLLLQNLIADLLKACQDVVALLRGEHYAPGKG